MVCTGECRHCYRYRGNVHKRCYPAGYCLLCRNGFKRVQKRTGSCTGNDQAGEQTADRTGQHHHLFGQQRFIYSQQQRNHQLVPCSLGRSFVIYRGIFLNTCTYHCCNILCSINRAQLCKHTGTCLCSGKGRSANTGSNPGNQLQRIGSYTHRNCCFGNCFMV